MKVSLYTRAMICLDAKLALDEITYDEYWDKMLAISVFYKRRALKQWLSAR
jgi:hypothetical protein